MSNICDWCSMYGKCTCATSVTCVTHIAYETHATNRTPILHMICVTVDAVTDNKDTSGIALVRSCGAAGVATGDGRHQPFDEPPPGADGSRFESTPWTVGTLAAYGRSKFTSCNTKTPFFVFQEGRVRGSRSPNPKLAFRPWPLASSQPDRAEGRTGIRRGPGYAARRIPPTAL